MVSINELLNPAWSTRLRETIELISPYGSTFTPKWRGDDRTHEKNIGIFEYPHYGTVTQDLGLRGFRQNLTFYFDGPNNDIDAQEFEKSFEEPGAWDIIHPVKGLMKLQPVSMTVKEYPVESGNITEIQSEWIKSKEAVSLILAIILAIIDAVAFACQIAYTAMFVSNTVSDNFTQIQSTRQTISDAITSIESNLFSLISKSSEIVGEFNAIKREINGLLLGSSIDLEQMGGAIQGLILTPIDVSDDYETRFSAYSALTDEILALSPTGATQEDRNRVAVQELVLSSIILANSRIISSSSFDTRSKVLRAAEDISERFTTITDALDLTQSAFSTTPIDYQYFSQRQSFSESYTLTINSIAIAIKKSFDLKIEKRYVIESPIATIRFVIEKYGQLGENDELLDLFIASNNLKSDEILLLPRGKEVVVYAAA